MKRTHIKLDNINQVNNEAKFFLRADSNSKESFDY